MALTSPQLQALKADIAADPAFASVPHNSDGAFEVAAAYNLTASPDFWVWRTSVPQWEIVSTASVDGTLWNWTAYIARSQGERDGWRQMFLDTGAINCALANVRQGLADIFSGTQNDAPAQRAHLLAMGRRKSTRAEKLLASGTGSTASPATMSFEGSLSYGDIIAAWNS